ncbi:hypothetical protein G7K_3444-t2 [Saitoella complicata NRRL Y-17804]|uniref:F-box domain-containing protein n=1 Tax=Saitoella complicata (strain BCRC 22490 / CBS 7301 / JCM 7358 / NBRC 10748 / NRRL Y-17804) TaxID=698492 RepID=A0A0E9NHD1_SAICN|nr:hypothetical protein G7K_3444-t2 [Saitoella complicata NRRL Y-17804]
MFSEEEELFKSHRALRYPVTMSGSYGFTSDPPTPPDSNEFEAEEAGSTGPSYLLALPPELLLRIMSLADVSDLISLSQVNRTLFGLITTDTIWKRHCAPHTSPAPYSSFFDMYTHLLHREGWLQGVWIGDRQFYGSLLVGRYNPFTGRVELYEVRATRASGSTGDESQFLVWDAVEDQVDDTDLVSHFHPHLGLRPAPLLVRHGHMPPIADQTPPWTMIATEAHAVRVYPLNDDAVAGLPERQVWPSSHIPAVDRTLTMMSRNASIRHPGIGEEPFISKDLFKFFRGEDRSTLNYITIGMLRVVVNGRDVYESFGRLHPELMRRTKEKPLQGLWVGDYSAHGPEYLLLNYEVMENNTVLHAVKITGDPNVPRGEITFRVPDIVNPVRTKTSEDGTTRKYYPAWGQIAGYGFTSSEWTEAEFVWMSDEEIVLRWFLFDRAWKFEWRPRFGE